ncbi:expressed unknown protein [Seminavis robusta]|uniref:Uncharacterized protein n=1 Tax=Seminavis robusta TaxID=568900 RepID=A0A9N8HYA0_9STRA|nr:expressed unknown protein [Seminavis robusta]|eukprot:Sro2804_g337450.1 n/a (171) ;mRNA; r:5240-5752
MSSDESKPKEQEEAAPASSSSFTMPDLSGVDVSGAQSNIRQGIHQGCKWTVNGINGMLGQLQVATKSVQEPVSGVMSECEKYGTQAATHCRVAYERRHEFAPYYVAGAAIGVGGITALRRGRLPAVALGGLAGVGTYLALYEPLFETPTIEWPFSNLTGNLGLGGGNKKE